MVRKLITIQYFFLYGNGKIVTIFIFKEGAPNRFGCWPTRRLSLDILKIVWNTKILYELRFCLKIIAQIT